jgi:hypothetical protein
MDYQPGQGGFPEPNGYIKPQGNLIEPALEMNFIRNAMIEIDTQEKSWFLAENFATMESK